ncbi:phage portal protein [Bacillus wiedmannii]|uniref:phage portal protein n=1 Tax=Bacillus wiedmannii TaxID=1890302 RepID=UPI000CD8F551|nr:phage portal protein [Bacillus wiedmannii]MBG9828534.1 hypothetical protein [Bacillus wiedmannii]UOB95809.1 phage portal protein, SPP1 Gp6-like [Bacillus wiedmannii]
MSTTEEQSSMDIYRASFYAPHSITAPRKYYVQDPKDLKNLAAQILAQSNRTGEYNLLEEYYRNLTKINSRQFEDPSKPNNRVSYPFAEIICNSATSYFTGIPIGVVPTEKSRESVLKEIDTLNDTDDVNTELDRLSNIFGHAFEVHWRETVGDTVYPRFKAISPKNCMIFHSTDLEAKPIGAVIWITRQDAVTKETTYEGTAYTDTEYCKFSFAPEKEQVLIESEEWKPHLIGALPVIEYLNNEDRSSSFEKVMGQIDAYNLVNSDTFNDVEYWADSYLVLTEMSGTDSPSLRSMKQNRVLLVDGSGKAEFLNKNTNDKHLENIKDRLTSDIHKFAQVPNLHDEQFASNLSGTAIRMKIKDLEDKVSEKEKKFVKSLRKRYEIIFSLLDKKAITKTVDFVSFVFKRNIPTNLIEIAEMMSKTPEGVWSKKTMRQQYPIIYNEDEEVKELEKEAEEQVNAEMGANPFSAPKTPKPIIEDPPKE